MPGLAQNDPSEAKDAEWAYSHAAVKDLRAVTDRAGAVSKRWEYDPFGTIRTQSGPAASDFQDADEQRDPETGLINLRARYPAGHGRPPARGGGGRRAGRARIGRGASASYNAQHPDGGR